MLLAAVPVVGGSATVLVDQKISERQEERLSAFCSDVFRRLERLEEHDLPSDQLLERGAATAKFCFESWKPHLLASVVAGKSVDSDEVIKQSLLDYASSLSEVEFCTLTSLAVNGASLKIVVDFGSLRATLSKLETHDKNVVSLRKAAFVRLNSFGLSETADDDQVVLTQLGKTLLELAST